MAAVGNKETTDGILAVLEVTNAVAQEAGGQLGREIVGLFLVIDFLVGRLGSLSGQSKDEIARMLAGRSLRQSVDVIVTEVNGLYPARTGQRDADCWVTGEPPIAQCETE